MGKNTKSGFALLEESYVNEISSQAKIYSHEKTGARLLFLINDDDNKVFCSSFKTPPEDDTGVAHIMEHSVLCGSAKYPVKEPFVELMKGSLNTFLNAMTYPDKTIYPVASRNLSDFKNLVDVYMDAVFFPELAKEAFEQEGWHYEVGDSSDISYKGVVFNEMKGVFSSPESYLDLETNRALFEQSSYKWESGGYPPAIPELSYEDYLKFHREKYHPANSWIILYGDLEEDYWLDYVDSEYLSKFSSPDFPLPEIISQPLRNVSKEITCSYPASDDTPEDNTFLSISFIVGSPIDNELNFSMGVLDAILIGSAGSPLKKALLESKLGKDTLDYGYCNETLQTSWSVGLRDSSPEKKEDFKTLVFGTLRKLVDDGIPEKMVAAAMNTCEFQLREANFGSYPKGLVYSMNVMSRWLYDGHPLDGLKYEDLLEDLKRKIAHGRYFEELIEKVFLQNENYVLVSCLPDAQMGPAIEKAEKDELCDFKQTLDDAALEDLRNMNQILLKRQMTPDSPEALATIPRVSVDDLTKTVERIPTNELEKNGVKFLYHDLPSQKICYLHLNFDTSFLDLNEFEWLSLFNSLQVKCGTEDLPYDEFVQNIAIHTGGISSTLNIYSSYLNKNLCGSALNLQGKAMMQKSSEFCQLLKEVLYKVDFKDLARVKNLIESMISRHSNTLKNHGDRVARNILNASLSGTGFLTNKVNSKEYLDFLKTALKTVEENPELFRDRMNSIKNQVYTRENLIVNIACDKEYFEEIQNQVSEVVEALPSGEKQDVPELSISSMENLGLIAPGAVQYVAKGINFKDLGYQNDGCFDLLNQLLSTGFLWEKVRVQGGAYGCYLSFDKISGALVIVSYRDPNLRETLEVFDAIADFLENLEMSQSEFEKLLIGTIGRLDTPMTTSQKSKLALNRYLAGIDCETLDKRRAQLLSSTVEDLKKFAVYFRALAEKGKICVHGSESKLKDAKDLFDKVISIGD